MNKGFANILGVVLIGMIAISSGFLGGFLKEKKQQKETQSNLGATIYETNLSDTINTFRTNVNSSLQNINNALPPQTLNTTSSPEFAGLTLTSKSGIAKFSSGILGTATSGTDYEVPLTASSGLNRVGNAFILNIASTTCGAASHVSSISATGTIVCSADTSTTTLSVSTLDVSSTSTLSNTTIGGTTSTISSTNLNIKSATTTFDNIPILPASNPTTDNQAARKAYVDTRTTGIATTTGISAGVDYQATNSGIAFVTFANQAGQSATLTFSYGISTSTYATQTAVVSGSTVGTMPFTYPIPNGYWYKSVVTGTGASGGSGLFFPFNYQ